MGRFLFKVPLKYKTTSIEGNKINYKANKRGPVIDNVIINCNKESQALKTMSKQIKNGKIEAYQYVGELDDNNQLKPRKKNDSK